MVKNMNEDAAVVQTSICLQADGAAPLTVGQLERRLLSLFPATDAETWDRTGLLVGDPEAPVTKVALTLDPTVEALHGACASGANVLLTHHPAFLSPPESFGPLSLPVSLSGAVVFEAARKGVALMDFHTALDASRQAQHVLPERLGLSFQRVVVPLSSDSEKGYGQLCRAAQEAPLTLGALALRAHEAFGRKPRVWGDADRPLFKVVTCTGAAGEVPQAALAAGADCLVCGEVKYHAALEYAAKGLALIELGHDVSEHPLMDVLASALVRECGLAEKSVVRLKLPDAWQVLA